jgi:hypothetical protein
MIPTRSSLRASLILCRGPRIRTAGCA